MTFNTALADALKGVVIAPRAPRPPAPLVVKASVRPTPPPSPLTLREALAVEGLATKPTDAVKMDNGYAVVRTARGELYVYEQIGPTRWREVR